MLKLDFDLGPMLAKVDRLEQTIKDSIWPAAFAASDTFYKEVHTRALTVGGSRRLQASVYQKAVKDSAKGVMGDLATYHVSWRKGHSQNNKDGQAGEGAMPSTTIGFWIEFGRWQRYMVRTDKNGEWYTVVRPEMRGKPAPKRGASQAEKDAYWMPRKDGPVYWLPKSFLRSSYDAKKAEATQAADKRLHELVREADK